MRWTVVGLFLFNIVFAVWGWLGYSYNRNVEALGVSDVTRGDSMPGAQLVLLKEASPSSVNTAKPVQQAVQTTTVAVEGGQVPLCVLLGPVLQPEKAKALLGRLAALQIQAKYVSLHVDGNLDYWVYLRPEPTKDLAIAKLRELQGKKIDSFIIPQGDLTNGISLGVFDSQENAESRRQAVAELGYDAQLRSAPRSYLENWVAIYPDQAVNFSPELYNQLHIENPALDLRKDECRKVASTIDIQ